MLEWWIITPKPQTQLGSQYYMSFKDVWHLVQVTAGKWLPWSQAGAGWGEEGRNVDDRSTDCIVHMHCRTWLHKTAIWNKAIWLVRSPGIYMHHVPQQLCNSLAQFSITTPVLVEHCPWQCYNGHIPQPVMSYCLNIHIHSIYNCCFLSY